MKIAIDISQIVYGTGVSVYTKKLVENLLKIDKHNNYVLFGGSLRQISNLKSQISKFKGNFIPKTYPIPPALADFIWNKLHVFPIEKLTGKTNLFHSSDWTQPPGKSLKITTVHDLMAIKYPKYVHPTIVAVQRRRLKRVKEEVNRIIVPSESTKSDLIEFGYNGNKIKVIYEANNIEKSSALEVEKTRKKFALRGKYFLAFGTGPYKNVKNVVKACEMLKYKKATLVIISRKPIVDIIGAKNVMTTGYIDENDYSGLMTGAEALIFPSFYEGFGIPVLDAYACETPVVTSNISSMPEIAGNAAVLVDPNSVDDIAKGINLAIVRRENLVNLGRNRVKKFSWHKTALETLDLYKELYARGK